jgi:streptomycin 6-kinase
VRPTAFEVPDVVRRKALAEGVDGRAWLDEIEGRIAALARAWNLSVGEVLSGGSEALVAEATTADGREAVLKIFVPGVKTSQGELRTLQGARGRGYAELLRHDPLSGAMLLERLGPQLGTLGLSVDQQFHAIYATLQEAWSVQPDDRSAFMNGAEKAQSLAAFIETLWGELGRPCAARTIDVALTLADARRRAFDPAKTVLGHGDGHSWNTLLVPGSEPPRYKFVDPDGLIIERAYDLGILMRDWGDELLEGDPVALGLQRCERLAALTGVEPEPIWQWGLIERTSSGLYLLQLGLEKEGRIFLTIADAWSAAEVTG